MTGCGIVGVAADADGPGGGVPDAERAVRLACHAMATRWELVIEGEDPVRARAAGEEALAEVRRLEGLLSAFRPTSEIGRVNAEAAFRPVRIDAEVFALVERAVRYHRETAGALDVTVGPLMRLWGFRGGAAVLPSAAELGSVRERVGMGLLELEPAGCTVRFRQVGVQLDLGAIGKGYAIGRAVETLRTLGIRSALLHGGTSSAYGLGRPAAGGAWKVAIAWPGEADRILAVVELEDRALAVSAPTGRSVVIDEVDHGHVLDPRIGRPAHGARLAAVVSPSATDADALSTALLVLGVEEHRVVTDARPELPVLVVGTRPAQVVRRGMVNVEC